MGKVISCEIYINRKKSLQQESNYITYMKKKVKGEKVYTEE